MSVEGGMKGMQQTFTCPRCGKSFTFWRPETQPGVKVKCYFCKNEFEDEAAKRAPAAAANQPPAASLPPAGPPETPEGPASEGLRTSSDDTPGPS